MENTWWTQPEQLDEDQTRVLTLARDANHLVVGPPGSGKTNLLLLRATFLDRAQERNIVVLTFNRVLREFLAAGVSNYSLAADKIQTYTQWGRSILLNEGVKIDMTGTFENIRSQMLIELTRLAKESARQNRFDCILIDEVQDYTPAEIEAIRQFGNRIFAVGDANQRIYESDGALAHVKGFCNTVNLTSHYRNGLKICRVADGMLDLADRAEGLEASSNYDEGKFPSSVKSFGELDVQSQVTKAVEEIETQLRAYPAGYIGILCPRHEELHAIIAALRTSPLANDIQVQLLAERYEAFDPSRRVVVATLHGAKGLEFRAVHLLAMDTIKKFALQKKIAYTAVTRAKTSLAIYHEGTLPGYLEKGLAIAADAAQTTPAIQDLFRKL